MVQSQSPAQDGGALPFVDVGSQKTGEKLRFWPHILEEWGYGPMLIRILKITLTSSRLPKFRDAQPSNLREWCARVKNK